MNIEILGTRGNIESSAPRHSWHSGILIDNSILLDIGEKEFLKYKPKAIFLTHLHEDHAYFVKSKKGARVDAPIFGPEEYINTVSVKKMPLRKQISRHTITSVPTIHSAKVASAAYIVSDKKHKVLYTGDLLDFKKSSKKLLKCVDVAIIEGSFIRKGGMIRKDQKSGKRFGHAGIPDLIYFLKRYAHVIAITHFGEWFYKDMNKGKQKLLQLGRQAGVEVIVGYDRMIIELRK